MYSDPSVAQTRARKYLGKSSILYESSRKDKKYMVKSPDGRWVHFGQLGYEDFTKHKDPERRQRYLSRATNIRGNWNHDPYSPNNLAIHVLW
jgi:hypothetical protein